ncbi:MAG: RnfH family protein [Gammaproteobacteria bacterium]|nr:RnfH family protein [Gammaproteobacteria bacterium]
MNAGARKRCLVACDSDQGVYCIEVELDAGASIADALAAARACLPGVQADWDGGRTGIWGEPRPRGDRPADGERIELYRPLPQDPRVRRRDSVQRSRRAHRRPP